MQRTIEIAGFSPRRTGEHDDELPYHVQAELSHHVQIRDDLTEPGMPLGEQILVSVGQQDDGQDRTLAE